MLRTTLGALAAVLLTGALHPAAAQVVDPQPRPLSGIFGGNRPRDPNRTSQELTLNFDFGAGYDRNVGREGEELPPQFFSPLESGFSGSAAGELRYWRGRTVRYFETYGRGYANPHVGVNPVLGGGAGVRAATDLGRRTGTTASFDLSYEPTLLYTSGTSAPTQTVPSIPDVTPPSGVIEQRWVAGQAVAMLYRHWTPRQRMDVQYGKTVRRPVRGAGLDSDTGALQVRHTWAPRPAAALLLTYRFDDNRQEVESGVSEPVRYHDAQAGVRLQHRLSSTRSFVFSVSGGATYARVRPVVSRQLQEFTIPSGSASARFDLGRSWFLSTDVARGATVLGGVSPEPFKNTFASIGVAGVVGRRTNVTMSVRYNEGAGLVTRDGAFNSTDATGQVQIAVTRWGAFFASYTYYDHEFSNIVSLAPAFPGSYSRHTGRVGFTVMLPLYGSF